jgi:hypothetical protein
MMSLRITVFSISTIRTIRIPTFGPMTLRTTIFNTLIHGIMEFSISAVSIN